MSNVPAAFRSVIIYLICIPLALVLGYMLTSPLQWSTFGTVGIVLLILMAPLLLKFHHPLLLLGWNASMIVFFLPGAPKVWLPLAAVSLAISVVQRTVDQDFRFISVPSVTWPLLALVGVVLVTAEATGGIHLRSMSGAGQDIYGGKRYVLILAAIAGYFAITAQRVPGKRAALYASLFILGGATTIVGDALYLQNRAVRFLYWFFPPNPYYFHSGGGLLDRFNGASGLSVVLIYYMLAKYGIRNIFVAARPWRYAALGLFTATSLLGGFRSIFAGIILICTVQFFLEGLHRTKLLPVLLLVSALGAAVCLPFVKYFPFSVQRSLSFLPIQVDQAARMNAQASTDWRLHIWKAVLPQVPRYLLLGKGLGFSAQDFNYAFEQQIGAMSAVSAGQDAMALAGDYHNGPLSLVIPFGIWGVMAFLWFLAAGLRVLYRNYRYGDPALQTVNTFLLAFFITRIIMYFFVFGGFYSDIQFFVGYLALGVCLNGGVASPAVQPIPEALEAPQVPAPLPQRRPAFGRSA